MISIAKLVDNDGSEELHFEIEDNSSNFYIYELDPNNIKIKQNSEDNIYKFNQELLEEWFEERGEFLQDGCSYFFGGACYDLAGFGENGCNIDPESIEKAFN